METNKPNEKRRKPVFAPMKIKVKQAETPAPSPVDLALDRNKAAPQNFDGTLPAEEPVARPKDEEPVIEEEPLEPLEPSTKPESIIVRKKAGPVNRILRKYKQQELSEVHSDPYRIKTPPPAWVPPSRRGFAQFFDSTFAEEGEHAAQFTLQPKLLGEKDWDACKKIGKSDVVESFLYQQFIREYLRSSSPYRGLLVYHGLGSGKTCSAISAAEALFGTSNKKIIIMTPGSLRGNFQAQISFCGFRHFREKTNHWLPINLDRPGPDIDGATLHDFALNVLNIPEDHLKRIMRYPAGQRNIWLPDFDQKPNYDTLDSESQTQIREQIRAVLENRIQFINYNGNIARKLQDWACEDAANPDKPGHFDDAIIIIDEIHNLSRLMRGSIHSYMEQIPTKRGKPRLVPPEPVTPQRWQPRLCSLNKKYKQGFLLYRFISEARNSKVIGLSGTPLINFPDELGPLCNMIAGYTHAIKFIINDKTEATRKTIKDIAAKHSRVDLIEFTPGQMDMQLLLTVFPDGYVKVVDGSGEFIGVREAEEKTQTTSEVAEEIYEAAKRVGVNFKGPYELISYPLLPVNPKEFNKYFVNPDTHSPEHVNVLKKRLYGLISYYKGASDDLMPTVKEDIVVPVRFSEFALQYYTKRRVKELAESPSEIAQTEEVDPYDEVSKLSEAANPSNYRFNSRAACNFAFPPSIRRPYRSVKKEEELAGEVEDRITTIITDEAFDVDAAAEEEARAAAKEEAEAEVPATESDSTEESESDTVEKRIVQEFLNRAEAQAKEQGFSLKDDDSETTDRDALRRLEPYSVRLQKALNQLSVQKNTFLRLDGPADSNLNKYSPKFAAVLKNILDSELIPGSSLIYSQFNNAEGLRIFGYAMEANKFTHIKFSGSETDPELTSEAEASLRKGPGAKENRFMFFTGEGSPAERAIILNIFNGSISKLPPKIQKVMMESGYEELGNKHGEICKVIGITAAGTEGLSLKFVRGVHIIEPYWNDVRLTQAKGRAVRICSHAELPPEERTVSVYTYVATFTKEDIEEKRIIEELRNKDENTTSDQHVYNLSQKKKALTSAFEKILKEVAVDCVLNSSENEKGLKCYQGIEGEVKDHAMNPSIDVDVQASNIEEKPTGGPKATDEPAPKRAVTTFEGKRVVLIPDTSDINIIIGYDELDKLFKRPIVKYIKNPLTGKYRVEKQ